MKAVTRLHFQLVESYAAVFYLVRNFLAGCSLHWGPRRATRWHLFITDFNQQLVNISLGYFAAVSVRSKRSGNAAPAANSSPISFRPFINSFGASTAQIVDWPINAHVVFQIVGALHRSNASNSLRSFIWRCWRRPFFFFLNFFQRWRTAFKRTANGNWPGRCFTSNANNKRFRSNKRRSWLQRH